MLEEQTLGPAPGCMAPGAARPGRWYQLAPLPLSGLLPEPRVGHTATYLPRLKQVILIGGASPHALYSTVWQLDLQRLSLALLRLAGRAGEPENGNGVEDEPELEPEIPPGSCPQRYEHCAFVPPPQELSDKVRVFAGANIEEGALNDLWELDLAIVEWKKLDCTGSVPAPRTMHTNTADVSGALQLFGGGYQGASPVADQSVYRLDPVSRVWSTVSTRGEPPAPRQGHVLVGVDGKLICHGGMAGNKFFSDLHILRDGEWVSVEQDPAPSARAGHGAVCLGHNMYIFGGLGPHGSLDDMWKLNVDSLLWEEISSESDSPRPKPRLDFAMSLIWLPSQVTPTCSNGEAVNLNGAQSEDSSSPDSEHDIPFVLLHGGMDDLGNIYNDFHLFCLEDLNN